MQSVTFYSCGACGILSLKNFRDDSCPVCKTIMNCQAVTLFEHVGGLALEIQPAPHTDTASE